MLLNMAPGTSYQPVRTYDEFYSIINFHARHGLCLSLAQVGGFHLQGTSGRGNSELCLALNNAADGSHRLAHRVKINKMK